MSEKLLKDLIEAIIGLSVSVDELTTELQQEREAIGSLEQTIKNKSFTE